MKKTILGIVALLALSASAHAQTEDKHALGNLYTKGLNVVESAGMLDTLAPKKEVKIIDLHADHGQIIITVQDEDKPKTIIYDLMTNKIISQQPAVE